MISSEDEDYDIRVPLRRMRRSRKTKRERISEVFRPAYRLHLDNPDYLPYGRFWPRTLTREYPNGRNNESPTPHQEHSAVESPSARFYGVQMQTSFPTGSLYESRNRLSTPQHTQGEPANELFRRELTGESRRESLYRMQASQHAPEEVTASLVSLSDNGSEVSITENTLAYKYPKPRRPIADHQDGTESCVICVSDLQENENVRRLTCMHLFHKECIDQWLVIKMECPMCRTHIDDRQLHPHVDNDGAENGEEDRD